VFLRAADALFLVLTTAAAAAPAAYMVAFLDGLNDKPWGSHATATSYFKVVFVAGIAASIAGVAARAAGRPRSPEARHLLFGMLAVATVNLSFCLWAQWLFEVRKAPWQNATEFGFSPSGGTGTSPG
jgi:hypothetical protein